MPLRHIAAYVIVDKTPNVPPNPNTPYWMWCSTNNYPDTPQRLWVTCIVTALEKLYTDHINAVHNDAQSIQISVRVQMENNADPEHNRGWTSNTEFLRNLDHWRWNVDTTIKISWEAIMMSHKLRFDRISAWRETLGDFKENAQSCWEIIQGDMWRDFYD